MSEYPGTDTMTEIVQRKRARRIAAHERAIVDLCCKAMRRLFEHQGEGDGENVEELAELHGMCEDYERMRP